MTTLGGVFCDLYSLVREPWRASRDCGGGHFGVDNKMQSICICFVQSEFFSKLFHNLCLNSTAMDIPVLSDGLIVGW